MYPVTGSFGVKTDTSGVVFISVISGVISGFSDVS